MEKFNLRLKTLLINVVLFVAVSLPIRANFFIPENTNGATVLYDSCKVYYATGLYKKAIYCLDNIIKIKSQSGQDSYPEYYKVYNFYGIIYKNLGLLEKAEGYYKKTLSFSLPLENKAKIFMNLGNLYVQKGDFNSAITYYNKVQSLILHLDYPRLLANSYYNMGVAYNNTSQYKLALKYLLLSIDTRNEAGLPEDGETILLCATSYYKKGQNDTAELYFQKAIRCFRKTVGEQHYSTALAYNNYAELLVNKNDYGRALEYYNKCLGILNKSVGEKQAYKSDCFQSLGNLYDRLKGYEKALTYYQKALIAKVNNFNDTSTYSNPINCSISDIKMLYLLKSKAFTFESLSQEENEEKNLVAAFNTLELNVKLTEQLRSGYLYEGSMLKLSENEDDTYKALVRITAKLWEKTGEQKYAEAAFKYSEKGKYGVLREFYNEEAQMKAASIPDSLYEKQKAIRKRLNSLRFQIEEENSLPKPDEGKSKFLQEQLFEETQSYESLLAWLEKEYPLYHRENNGSVDIKSFQSKLYADQVALEFTIADSTLYTFFVSKDTFMLRKTGVDSSFFSSFSFYREFLSSQDYLSHDTFRISAYCLYQNLMQPFENEIKDKSLLIIPDGSFSLIPFGAMVDEPYTAGSPYNNATEPYILRKYPIGYAFSASLYVESFHRLYSKRNHILAIAPDYRYSDGTKVKPHFLKKHLRRLTLWCGKYFDGEKATETNFKNHVSGYNIIHVYAHGRENLDVPSKSNISLEADSSNDGKLYAHEIAGLQLRAKLVVLASCFSGSGKIAEGEGVMSIGRSFMGTGASSVVMSLWYTYLETATEQLLTMQKHLIMGKRKDKALQLAKLRYLKKSDSLSGHPKEWASLVVVGNQEPLYHIRTIIIGIGVFVFLGVALSFLYLKRRSSSVISGNTF